MSVGKVIIEILQSKGFNLSEIARLSNTDRSALSHVLHESKNYSGKKMLGRLNQLLIKTGYTKEEYDRIQNAIYHRTPQLTSVVQAPEQTTTTTAIKRNEYDEPCNICGSIEKLYKAHLKGGGMAPFFMCTRCYAVKRAQGMIINL